jgi:hypothetical protein
MKILEAKALTRESLSPWAKQHDFILLFLKRTTNRHIT